MVMHEELHRHQYAFYLVLHIFITELQLHDVLKRPKKRLVEMKMWKFGPAAQHLYQHIMDE